MAYAAAGLKCVVSGGHGGGPSIWQYQTTDAHTDVDASGYFTDSGLDGKFRMKVHDIVFVVDTDTDTCTVHTVETVAASSATINAATLA